MSAHRTLALAGATVLLVILAFSHGGPARATGFTIDSTGDAVDANPGDGVCATAGGQCTLRAAIMETNALPGADTITLPAGTYTLSIAGPGEDASATGDLDVTDDLTITGAGSAATVINANGAVTSDGGMDVIGDITVEISGLTMENGTAPCCGGALWNEATLTLTDVSLINSTAPNGGGFSNEGTATLTNVTVSGNTATVYDGGGVRNSGSLTITNSTISGNSATGEGGGIFLGGPTSTLALLNVTIAFNTADSDGDGTGGGGGIANGGLAASFKNTIIARNADPGTPSAPDCSGPLDNQGHNLVQDPTCAISGSFITGQDPLLGPLAGNGGPTQTHALLPNSPAIDHGDNAGCPVTDQRGVARPIDGDGNGLAVCDIGAYEAPEGSAPTPTPSPSPAPTSTPAPGQAQTWGNNDCGVAVDAVDALKALRYVAALTNTRPPDCPEIGAMVHVAEASDHPWGDVDCSGSVDAVDALKVLRHVAALPVAPVAGCPEIGAGVQISVP